MRAHGPFAPLVGVALGLVACGQPGPSRGPARATRAPDAGAGTPDAAPSLPPHGHVTTFELTLERIDDRGHSVIHAASSGSISYDLTAPGSSAGVSTTATEDEVTSLRTLLEDPALVATTSASGSGPSTQLHVAGDLALDRSFAGAPPPSVTALVAALDRVVNEPQAPRVRWFELTLTREREGLAPLAILSVRQDRVLLVRAHPPDPDKLIVLSQATTDELEAMLREPALEAVPASTAGAGGVTDTLVVVDDDHAYKLQFAEPAPAAVRPLIERLDALLASSPAPAFTVTLTVQTIGRAGPPPHVVTVTSAGALTVDDGGQRTSSRTLTPDEVASVASVLATPPMADATSNELGGAGTLVTLRSTGDLALELHYPIGEGPTRAMFAQDALEKLALPPRASPAALGDACGGRGVSCGPGLLCDHRECGSDRSGTCVATPPACPDDEAPVCACGDRTYRNDCERLLGHRALVHVGACAP